MKKLYMDEEWLREHIEVKGLTFNQTADICGTKHYNVRHWAKKFGIERPGSTKKITNMSNSEKCRDKEWLYHHYVELDKSYDQIKEEFNIGKTTIARWVKRHGLTKKVPQHFRGKLKNKRPNVEVECEFCKEVTKQKYAKVKNGHGRFCSQSCAAKQAYESEVGEKLREGNKKYRQTDKAKSDAVKNGIKAVLAQKGNDTWIELEMKSMLNEINERYLDQKEMYYWVCDFYLPEYDLVIEVMGDYWHANPSVYSDPNEMQRKNIRRDKGKRAYLKKCGHYYIEFWEKDIKDNREWCKYKLYEKILEIKKASA